VVIGVKNSSSGFLLFVEVVVMSLTEARFHDLVDATQEAIEDVFDSSELDLDLENSAGVLTVRFDNGSQLIFSRQEPLRQLWLAARSGGFHFDYDAASERWMCDTSDELLGEMLARLTLEQCGAELEFEEL
jgi:CyaY protein